MATKTKKPIEMKAMQKTAKPITSASKGELNRGQGVTSTSNSGAKKMLKKSTPLTNAKTTAQKRKQKYVK